MSNDAEAQEVNPAAMRPGSGQEPMADGTSEPYGLVGEEDVADPDAVIIEEDDMMIGEAPPAAASGRPGRDRAAAQAYPAGAAASDRGTAGASTADAPTAGAGTAGTAAPGTGTAGTAAPGTGTVGTTAGTAGTTAGNAIPEAARPQTPANGDTGMAGDPQMIHERWAAIQATFVDDPRGCVAAAAELVTETIAALVATAEQQESGLRGEWNREGADTEDLRNVLRGYRGLLDRLIAI